MALPAIHDQTQNTANGTDPVTTAAIAASAGDLLIVEIGVPFATQPTFKVHAGTGGLTTEDETISANSDGSITYNGDTDDATHKKCDIKQSCIAAANYSFVYTIRLDTVGSANSVSVTITWGATGNRRYRIATVTPGTNDYWPTRAARLVSTGGVGSWSGSSNKTLTLSAVTPAYPVVLASSFSTPAAITSTYDADNDTTFEISGSPAVLESAGGHFVVACYDTSDAHRPGTGNSNDKIIGMHPSGGVGGTGNSCAWCAAVYMLGTNVAATAAWTEDADSITAAGSEDEAMSVAFTEASDTVAASVNITNPGAPVSTLPATEHDGTGTTPVTVFVGQTTIAAEEHDTAGQVTGGPAQTTQPATEHDEAPASGGVEYAATYEVDFSVPSNEYPLTVRVYAQKRWNYDIGDICIGLKQGDTVVQQGSWVALSTYKEGPSNSDPVLYSLSITNPVTDVTDLRVFWSFRKNETDSLDPIVTYADILTSFKTGVAEEHDTAVPPGAMHITQVAEEHDQAMKVFPGVKYATEHDQAAQVFAGGFTGAITLPATEHDQAAIITEVTPVTGEISLTISVPDEIPLGYVTRIWAGLLDEKGVQQLFDSVPKVTAFLYVSDGGAYALLPPTDMIDAGYGAGGYYYDWTPNFAGAYVLQVTATPVSGAAKTATQVVTVRERYDPVGLQMYGQLVDRTGW